MALTLKEKELVAVGISVAAGCRPCTTYHLKEVRKAEASDPEVQQAVVDAMRVRRSATEIMERHALEHPDAIDKTGPAVTTRTQGLVSIGAAFAVNCSGNLSRHLKSAEGVGISKDEIGEVVNLSAFIKEVAATHVKRLVGLDQSPKPGQAQAATTGCGC